MIRKSLVLSLAASLALLGWFTVPDSEPETQSLAVAVPAPVSSAPPALHTETVDIRKRDTVGAALQRHDIASSIAHEITGMLRAAGARLRKVRAGEQLELSRDAEGRLVALAYEPSPWTRFEVTDKGNGWEANRTDVEPEVRIEVRQGEVRQSLWEAVEAAGIAPTVLLDLVQIFESEIDFAADVRSGDRFRFLVETRYAKGVPVDHGRILAAQYINDGRTLTGIGFQEADHFAYYDTEGRSLKRTFLRSPLQFTRISSGFSHRRPHPILGGLRPHLAIDYAAPKGTPVWAVADGTVQFAGRKGGNGIQVQLRHRSGYSTYYNHLSRLPKGIRRGVHVSQKQVIGYVGSTGLSSGPHLDYRVSHKGVFLNPISERFLPGDPIAKALRPQFLERARMLVERLDQEAPFKA
jgi:murein DD-endopeptidase MepM/ murein hydrolase activator NlpD